MRADDARKRTLNGGLDRSRPARERLTEDKSAAAGRFARGGPPAAANQTRSGGDVEPRPGAFRGGSFDLRDLEDRPKDDLYAIAKGLRIEGRCRMSRQELIEAIRAAGRRTEPAVEAADADGTA